MRSEEDIMRNWVLSHEPLVSIVCVTYNHEKYISDAINGFLMQETNFSFEILLGEDCSTDKTMDIVKDYMRKYPRIIKVVSGPENVGPAVNHNRVMDMAKGEYIANCDGDDYWTDSKKLQIQVQFMEEHPECSMSFHPALQVLMTEEHPQFVRNKRGSAYKLLDVDEVILSGGGWYPSAALMFRRKAVLKQIRSLGDVDTQGDYVIAIACVAVGSIGYIGKVMSVYRKNPDSVTQVFENKYTEKEKIDYRKNLYDTTVKAMREFDSFLDGKYASIFLKSMSFYSYQWAIGNVAKLKLRDAYRLNDALVRRMSWSKKTKLFIRYFIKFSRLKWRV